MKMPPTEAVIAGIWLLFALALVVNLILTAGNPRQEKPPSKVGNMLAYAEEKTLDILGRIIVGIWVAVWGALALYGAYTFWKAIMAWTLHWAARY